MQEEIRRKTNLTIVQYNEDTVSRVAAIVGGEPTSEQLEQHTKPDRTVVYIDTNLITNAGKARFNNHCLGITGFPTFGLTTTTRFCVGNSSTAVSGSDTNLNASASLTARYCKPIDSQATLTTTNVSQDTMHFETTMGTSEANFAWEEFGLDVGSPTVTAGISVNTLLTHGLPSPSVGTKGSGAIWIAKVDIVS